MPVANQLITISKKPRHYKENYIQISNDEWEKAFRELSSSAFGMWLWLVRHDETFKNELSKAAFKKDLGLSDSTYERAWKELKDKGYAVKDKKHNNLYFILSTVEQTENTPKNEGKQQTKTGTPPKMTENTPKIEGETPPKMNREIDKIDNINIQEESSGKPEDSSQSVISGSNKNTPKNGGVLEEPEVESDGKSKETAIIISREKLCILVDNQNYKVLGNNFYKIADKYYTVVD